MNLKKFFIAAIATSAFVFVFDMIWHGMLMSDLYKATASVWRPEAEMNQNMRLMVLTQIAFGFAMTFLYSKVYKSLACKRGILFGLAVGLVLAIPSLSWYCHLPIPFTIPALWFVADIIKCVGCGVVIAAIYKEIK